MLFERTNPDCKFTVPDKITVRMQMAYFSMATIERNPEMWERMWNATRELIQDWTCPLMANKDMDLDEITNPQITQISADSDPNSRIFDLLK